jgi:hypothetical protein
MQKRRVYLILVVVVLAGVLVAVFRRDREPEYGGKRLSEWVDGYAMQIRNAGSNEAIRHIGTNAVPYLLKWIRYETPG